MPKGSAMCGYSILGNHLRREDPKIEWDINIDEIVQGNYRLVGVSVGTFVVKGKKRTPRAPVTQVSFATQDDPAPIAAQIIGAPNKDNAVRGTLDLERAKKLFDAFSYDRQISATLVYTDGTSDLLKFEGFRDSSKFGGGKNSPFEECLRGITPRVTNFNTQRLP
jgi:hypothetical protein